MHMIKRQDLVELKYWLLSIHLLVHWYSKVQKTIAMSSTESEYVAIAMVVRIIKYFDMFLHRSRFSRQETTRYSRTMMQRLTW